MTRIILFLIAFLATIALISAQTTSLTLLPAGTQLNACQTNLTLIINPTIAIAPNYTLISRSYVWMVNTSNLSTALPNSINSTSVVVNLQTLLTLTNYTFGVNIIDLILLPPVNGSISNTTQISQFIWATYPISVNNGTILTSGSPQFPLCASQNTSTGTGNNNNTGNTGGNTGGGNNNGGNTGGGGNNNGTNGTGASIKNSATPIIYGGVLYHVSSSVAVMIMIGFVMMIIDSIFY